MKFDFFKHTYIFLQSNEVHESNHMEKKRSIRSITNTERKGLKIEKIITDRHLHIQKHVREYMPNTTHNYDEWHFAKGMFSNKTGIRIK